MKKALNLQLPFANDHAFRFTKIINVFFPKYHQHKEIQFTHIEIGSGYLQAGDFTGRYNAGDVFLINSFVPHIFKPDNEEQQQKSYNVYFSFNSLGIEFWQLSEVSPIRQILEQNNSVIKILGSKQTQAALILKSFKEEISLHNITLFTKLLALLENKADLEFISGSAYLAGLQHHEKERMSTIIQYSLDHYHEQIAIKDVAAEIGLSITSFCRYFKLQTGKTYLHFLHELRIHHACKILIDSNTKIEQIAYATGFTQLSHFNKLFKQYKKVSPGVYRQKQSIVS